jgi:hypothetical protein
MKRKRGFIAWLWGGLVGEDCKPAEGTYYLHFNNDYHYSHCHHRHHHYPYPIIITIINIIVSPSPSSSPSGAEEGPGPGEADPAFAHLKMPKRLPPTLDEAEHDKVQKSKIY